MALQTGGSGQDVVLKAAAAAGLPEPDNFIVQPPEQGPDSEPSEELLAAQTVFPSQVVQADPPEPESEAGASGEQTGPAGIAFKPVSVDAMFALAAQTGALSQSTDSGGRVSPAAQTGASSQPMQETRERRDSESKKAVNERGLPQMAAGPSSGTGFSKRATTNKMPEATAATNKMPANVCANSCWLHLASGSLMVTAAACLLIHIVLAATVQSHRVCARR